MNVDASIVVMVCIRLLELLLLRLLTRKQMMRRPPWSANCLPGAELFGGAVQSRVDFLHNPALYGILRVRQRGETARYSDSWQGRYAWTLRMEDHFPVLIAETRTAVDLLLIIITRSQARGQRCRLVLMIGFTKDGDARFVFKVRAHRSLSSTGRGIETTLLQGRSPAILQAVQLTESRPLCLSTLISVMLKPCGFSDTISPRWPLGR
jgi:hypothetical protein